MQKFGKKILFNQITYLLFILFILLLVVIGIISVQTIFLDEQINESKKKSTVSQINYTKWLGVIKQSGGKKAYEEFGQAVLKKPISQQHLEAHLFGEALYEIEDLEGIIVCDTQFNYGCYHSFLGMAIHDKGLDIIPTLYDKCAQNLNNNAQSCPHGIGHGILSSLGYEAENLYKALDICQSVNFDDPYAGCFNGVFMEYNFQTMLADKAKKRVFDPDKPYSPCSEVQEQFGKSCMFGQSQWWLSTIPKPIKERVAQIESYCSEVTNDDWKQQCFLGLGVQIMSYVNYDLDRSKHFCFSLKDNDSKLNCRIGLVIYAQDSVHFRKYAADLCKDLSLTNLERKSCESYLRKT